MTFTCRHPHRQAAAACLALVAALWLPTPALAVKTPKPNQPPAVSLDTPADNTLLTAPATLTLTATATDTDGRIKKVDFYQGGTRLGSATMAPYSLIWNKAKAGSYTLTAKATDNLGAATISNPIQLTINAPPGIILTAPGNNTLATAPANLVVSGEADDGDGGISTVEVLANGDVIATLTAAPYTYRWNNIAAGDYTVALRATDNHGASTVSKGVTVHVDALPLVALTAPADNTLLVAPASLTLSATANDPDGSIKRIDFYQGGKRIGSSTNGGNGTPYTHAWNKVPAGTYVLTAQAIDNDNRASVSAPVTLIVDAPPKVRLTAPKANARLYAPASIALAATASDKDGPISRIDFYQGQTLLGSSHGEPYGFTWSNVAAGIYTLTAVAVDNLGTATTSKPVTIAVDEPPSVYLDQLQDGDWLTQAATLTLTAQAADADGSLKRVEFFADDVRLGKGVAGTAANGTTPYVFPWKNPAVGTYRLTARATDDRGGVTISPPVTVHVRGTVNQLPTVSLAVDSTLAVTPPGVFNLTAQASDADGVITRIDFHAGSTLLGSVTSPPYVFTWDGVPAGSHGLTAHATDDRDGSTTSAAVAVRVNALPSVSLTAPADGTLLVAPSDLTLSAEASDADGGVRQVDFYDGATWLGGVAAAPYSLTLANAAAGAYSFSARATDSDGAVTASPPVSVTVDAPPTVSLAATPVSLVAPGSVVLAATAADVDGAVARVDFYVGTTLLGTQIQAPYALAWNAIAAGTHVVTAVATDDKGASTTAAPVSFTVAANQPPSVALTSPADGHKLAAPASVTLAASAQDADGAIAKVEFYNGGTLLGTASQAPFSYAWRDVAAGSYSLTAVATDDKGAVATSSAATITVSPAQAQGVFYILPDQLGTPRAITDAGNRIVWWNDPLGEPFGAGAPDEDPDGDGIRFTFNLRFPGQYFDSETQLHYNYFRDYDPGTGRYVQSDPIGLAGGINTYSYVNGNPVSYVDPDGLRGGPGIPGFGPGYVPSKPSQNPLSPEANCRIMCQAVRYPICAIPAFGVGMAFGAISSGLVGFPAGVAVNASCQLMIFDYCKRRCSPPSSCSD